MRPASVASPQPSSRSRERLLQPQRPDAARPAPWSSAPAARNLLPGRGGEQLLVQGREASGDLRPVVAAAGRLRASAARPPFLLAVGGREEGVDERILIVGRDEPACAAVG